ncbi:MAG TPA: hypothetical protein PKX06_02315 [Phenylobacterium sp.]|nr:hypothetical protein [Phenylobacterium sp.]
MSIVVGALAPRFVCATTTNPRYTSAAFGGRYVLLAFLPTDLEGRRAALSLIVAHRGLFDDVKLSTYGVLRDETAIGMARDQTGLRWFPGPRRRGEPAVCCSIRPSACWPPPTSTRPKTSSP